MTAINAYLKNDRAILMTDASIYTPAGLVVGFAQKAVAMPTLKAAVAVRGAQKITALLAMEMSCTFQTVDQIVVAGERYFPTILAAMAPYLPEELRAVQIVVVGWSDDRGEAVGLWYDSTAVDEPFGEIEEWVMGPLPDEEEDRNLNLQGCELDRNLRIRDFDPIRHGIPIMEAQRRMKVALASAPNGDVDAEISIVGGHILLTEVTRSGVHQRVVHRWSDVAGENIAPGPFRSDAASQAPTTHPPGSTGRAERRRLEKLAKKQQPA